MDLAGIPRGTIAVAAVVVILSVASMFSVSTEAHLTLTPGNTLLGEHMFWNILTCHFVELTLIKLVLNVSFIFLLGIKAERGLQTNFTQKLLLTLVLSLGLSGLIVSIVSQVLYVYDQNEWRLYQPFFGAGPVAAVFATSAHQVAGETPLWPSYAPWLLYSHMPAIVVVVSALAQYALHTSRDLAATMIALVVSWMYLRFIHTYGQESVGDKRDEFEFLSMLPSILRVPLRPIIKLLSAVFMRCPVFSEGSGDGMKHLPLDMEPARYSNSRDNSQRIDVHLHVHGKLPTSAADPIAEKRRERALKALDKKLAELRTNITKTGPASSATAVTANASQGASGTGLTSTLTTAASGPSARPASSTPAVDSPAA